MDLRTLIRSLADHYAWNDEVNKLRELTALLRRLALEIDGVADAVKRNDPVELGAPPELIVQPLTFNDFRSANIARNNRLHPNGVEPWSPDKWLTALVGELGEFASLLKMRNRERDGMPGNKFSPTFKQIADELADTFAYLDLLAAAMGVDLGQASIEKFNEVSERLGDPGRIVLKKIGLVQIAVDL